MKRNLCLIVAAPVVLMAAVLTAACASDGPAVINGAPQAEGADAPRPAIATPVTGDRLDTREFAGLPPEARAYLAAVSRAFRNQDTQFLLAQGEKTFEAEVKPRYDDEAYLALLYRSGPYAADTPWGKGQTAKLEPSAIRGIEYIDWEEQGPMLAIQGRLIPKSGAAIPCKIILAWRLTEPKILGVYP